MALDPIEISERMADAVYERLRDAILEGRLPAGGRLSVPLLADELRVSRSPVREAVLRLVQEGLASEEPHKGAVVAHVPTKTLIDLYEVREVLEGLVARLAAAHSDPGFLATLRDAYVQHQRAIEGGDIPRHIELDMQFHQIMREGAGNPELVRLLDGIQVKVRLAMITTTVTAGPDMALREHGAILQSLTEGDAGEAERRARAHVARLRSSLADGAETSRFSGAEAVGVREAAG